MAGVAPPAAAPSPPPLSPPPRAADSEQTVDIYHVGALLPTPSPAQRRALRARACGCAQRITTLGRRTRPRRTRSARRRWRFAPPPPPLRPRSLPTRPPSAAARRSTGSGTAHSSKERRRPLFWQPFSTVTEPAPGLLVPLSGILASRRREQRKDGAKTSKNGQDMA